MDTLFDIVEETQLMGTPVMDTEAITQLLIRFFFNFVIVGIIIHFFYYPKSRRRDYYFTFSLINVSVFFLIILMGSVKLKIGFALGIFAIFGIIRYRTESVPIREMTYLFIIIALSVINALSVQISYAELIATNCIFILVTWLLESERWLKHVSCKLILYDKIQLIVPEKRKELIADLRHRTGLNIQKIEIGHIDFLRDAAFIKVYYESEVREINSVDTVTRFPREGE
ncbi:DUF4956 domain-containing protein [Parabacteroides faecis]|uniref:DUF4956 domain-containing protein n=1 Tax=Parabacteroides TaxID=375288 RepID=UPI000F007351|nr:MULTISPECIES: DUF4956 domain-containing protein [Parabacteroides]MBC8618558.1 DUF4956 domain-containing protein [Parabacteroides faecis]RHR94737.1 DUF4956 domain-containing protein [Parabacteroides sp. AF14-59]